MADNIRALKGIQYKKPSLLRVWRLKQEVPLKQAPESPAKLGCPISSKEVCVSEAGCSIRQAATAESEARLPSKTATKVSTHSPPWLEAVRHPPTLSSPNTLHIIKEQEFIPPAPPTTLAGRTATNWTKITSDPWVLETVGGYKLELVDSPVHDKLPVTRVNQEAAGRISIEVRDMVEKGAIHPLLDPLNQGFYSSTKEGWPDETGGEPPSSQPVPPLPTLQNRGDLRSKGSPSAKRLDEHDRSQRCVLHHP